MTLEEIYVKDINMYLRYCGL